MTHKNLFPCAPQAVVHSRTRILTSHKKHASVLLHTRMHEGPMMKFKKIKSPACFSPKSRSAERDHKTRLFDNFQSKKINRTPLCPVCDFCQIVETYNTTQRNTIQHGGRSRVRFENQNYAIQPLRSVTSIDR